jgi:hypothetical protein
VIQQRKVKIEKIEKSNADRRLTNNTNKACLSSFFSHQ